MRFFVLLFILVPIIEIGVFIQIGDLLGLAPTLIIVFVTAILGVNLLKQQGIRAWMDIQNRISSGQQPALEMASAAQLLFAGGLLLTPGFVTDIIGFLLMIPTVRLWLANFFINYWMKGNKPSKFYTHHSDHNKFNSSPLNRQQSQQQKHSRTIEGEYEDKTE